jgi:hypothetical protein
MTEVEKFSVMLDKIFEDKDPTKALIIDAFHKSKDGITKEEARRIFNAGAMWEQKATDQNFEDLWESMSKGNHSVIGDATERYLFWFESEGKDGWTFEIEAKDSNDAYDKAYDTHGPQVAGMMYQVKNK